MLDQALAGRKDISRSYVYGYDPGSVPGALAQLN